MRSCRSSGVSVVQTLVFSYRIPLSPRSPFTFLLFYLFTFKVYLIFSVMMVSAASMMVTIQKRMVIFDSWTTLLGPRHR